MESWFLCARFWGVKFFLGFGIYFLVGREKGKRKKEKGKGKGKGKAKAKARAKATAIIQSLHPSGFAPAFGRADAAARLAWTRG